MGSKFLVCLVLVVFFVSFLFIQNFANADNGNVIGKYSDCSDSDNRIDALNYGVVTVTLTTEKTFETDITESQYNDTCLDKENLAEWFCATDTEIGPDAHNITIPCPKFGKGYMCDKGTCVRKCTETDNGKDHLTKGVTYGEFYDFWDNTQKWREAADYCEDDILHEFYCRDASKSISASEETVNCTKTYGSGYYCNAVKHACDEKPKIARPRGGLTGQPDTPVPDVDTVPTPETRKCTDTDDISPKSTPYGKVYEKLGKTEGLDKETGEREIKTDYCTGPGVLNEFLREYYCEDENYFNYLKVNCKEEYGKDAMCYKGVCISVDNAIDQSENKDGTGLVCEDKDENDPNTPYFARTMIDGFSIKFHPDQCSVGNKGVYEGICAGNKVLYESHDCEYGCEIKENGYSACKIPDYCNEGVDGGYDPYKGSTTALLDSSDKIVHSQKDSCVSLKIEEGWFNPTKRVSILTEYFCNMGGGKKIESKTRKCINGCTWDENGARCKGKRGGQDDVPINEDEEKELETKKCTETDSGFEPPKPGTTCIGSDCKTDNCTTGDSLIEFYCDKTGPSNRGYEVVDCSKLNNGKCERTDKGSKCVVGVVPEEDDDKPPKPVLVCSDTEDGGNVPEKRGKTMDEKGVEYADTCWDFEKGLPVKESNYLVENYCEEGVGLKSVVYYCENFTKTLFGTIDQHGCHGGACKHSKNYIVGEVKVDQTLSGYKINGCLDEDQQFEETKEDIYIKAKTFKVTNSKMVKEIEDYCNTTKDPDKDIRILDEQHCAGTEVETWVIDCPWPNPGKDEIISCLKDEGVCQRPPVFIEAIDVIVDGIGSILGLVKQEPDPLKKTRKEKKSKEEDLDQDMFSGNVTDSETTKCINTDYSKDGTEDETGGHAVTQKVTTGGYFLEDLEEKNDECKTKTILLEGVCNPIGYGGSGTEIYEVHDVVLNSRADHEEVNCIEKFKERYGDNLKTSKFKENFEDQTGEKFDWNKAVVCGPDILNQNLAKCQFAEEYRELARAEIAGEKRWAETENWPRIGGLTKREPSIQQFCIDHKDVRRKPGYKDKVTKTHLLFWKFCHIYVCVLKETIFGYNTYWKETDVLEGPC